MSKDGGKTVHHATIISEVGNGEIKYAGHTGFATTEDLSEKMKEKPYETMVIVLIPPAVPTGEPPMNIKSRQTSDEA